EGPAAEAKGTVRNITPDELAVLFDGAQSVIVVPGYGMAVAQAQYAVSDLAKMLMKRGVDIKYAIHPLARRMPRHMNGLLAEANVPYDQLYEMEQINPYFAEADIALVVGANDVTNPAARSNKSSPLYGMPILEVDRAKSIIVLKRSMRPGFAGVDNDLYYNPKCMMLFGDAKESLNKLFAALKGGVSLSENFNIHWRSLINVGKTEFFEPKQHVRVGLDGQNFLFLVKTNLKVRVDFA